MEQIKWPTASIWFDETIEIFQMIQTGEEIEELAKKVAYKKAFEKSYKNATSTIVDGNITSLIVALVLYILGSGMVKGFGIVLAIGIVLSLVSSLLITRFVLKQFMPLANKGHFLFGLKKEKEVE